MKTLFDLFIGQSSPVSHRARILRAQAKARQRSLSEPFRRRGKPECACRMMAAHYYAKMYVVNCGMDALLAWQEARKIWMPEWEG